MNLHRDRGPLQHINVGLIRATMKHRNLSVAGLAHALELGQSTVERLLRGDASNRTLQLVAEFFGVEPQALLASQQPIDLSGIWYALYLEQEAPFAPYCVVEQLTVKQDGSNITGIYNTIEQQHPQNLLEPRAFTLAGEIRDRFVLGTYQRHIEDPDYPRGSGTFHLRCTRSDHWLEGFCTFFSDDELIASSLNIWIRQNIPNSAAVLEQAKLVMTNNQAFRLAPMSIPR